MAEEQKLTPMFAQYKSIKEQYPDALLFYRMGDFYELFFEDAEITARELQLALTSRSRDEKNAVPMCGVPWHAAEAYLAQLVDKGYSVAICDQIEDPRTAKGLVKRAVTRVLTPGTVIEDSNLNAKRHSLLGSVLVDSGKERMAFAWADVSTGQWSGTEFRNQADLWQWVAKMAPRELLLPDNFNPDKNHLPENTHLVRLPALHYDLARAGERLLAAQGVQDLAALGLDGKQSLVRACGALLAYLSQTQMREPGQLAPFAPLDLGRRLVIDDVTERNLELFARLGGQRGKGTLIDVLDDTITPMGGRLLGDMLHHPWRELETIVRIQGAVAFFNACDGLREQLRTKLTAILDLERISTRICLNRCTPKDFLALRNSLAALPAIPACLEENGELPPVISSLLASWDSLQDLSDLLARSIADDPPAQASQGGLFKPGYNAELDSLNELASHGEQKLDEMLEQERQASGLAKMKLGYNRVFGYYFEISRSAIGDSLPEHFIRRQTLANAERFTTDALKELEEKIVTANDQARNLEYTLFAALREHVASQRERIVNVADLVAQLDYWQCLAHVGRNNGWCLPELCDGNSLEISAGRHPVVEQISGRASFVPNDFRLDENRRLCLLTGPNMGGKSTVLRQVALICIMAQMGAMVPASKARLGLVDRLFSRVGASDNLAFGQSTFMIEMMECARILRQAGKRSLIILDEIGRGTSTHDGLAIAWSIVEYLAGKFGKDLRVLFATHYHELINLEGRIPGLFTMNLAISEHGGEIVFLHKLVPGPSDRSYGIEVARLAGVPLPVVQRAREILSGLEQLRSNGENRRIIRSVPIRLPGIGPKDRS